MNNCSYVHVTTKQKICQGNPKKNIEYIVKIVAVNSVGMNSNENLRYLHFPKGGYLEFKAEK